GSFGSRSAYPATLPIPASRQARAMRTAISPRLAIRTLRTVEHPSAERRSGHAQAARRKIWKGSHDLPRAQAPRPGTGTCRGPIAQTPGPVLPTGHGGGLFGRFGCRPCSRRAGGEYGGEYGDLLGGRLTPDHGQVGRVLRRTHSGMFPCFLGGSCLRLFRSALSALATWSRVSDGMMTPST